MLKKILFALQYPILILIGMCLNRWLSREYAKDKDRVVKWFKLIIKYIFLLALGGSVYCLLEILFRGRTHFSMFIVGGLCYVLCGLLNEVYTWEMPMWKQMGISAIIITVVEFIAGVIVNLILKLNVWDYSNLPLNILGQVCLPFTLLWFFLSAVAIIADDYIRYYFFDEEKPHYKWL